MVKYFLETVFPGFTTFSSLFLVLGFDKNIFFQRIRDITGCSLREDFTIAALNTFPYMYDTLLPPSSEWHKNGGAAFYYE